MNSLERIRSNLARDTRGGWIAGVCAGMARYFNIDPAFVRVGAVVLAVFSWKIVLATYVVAWILLPASSDGVTSGRGSSDDRLSG